MAMQFRAPRRAWEWVLLFSPAPVIWAATAIGSAIPGKASELPFLAGAFYGSIVALVISAFAGNIFTNPNPQPAVRYSGILLAAILIFILNLGIAFAGCAVVLMR